VKPNLGVPQGSPLPASYPQAVNALSSWQRALLSGAAELGLSISAAQLAAYTQHLDLLLSHKVRAGLTAITEPEAIAIKHFLDSLTCLLVRDIGPGERVADIGSGGGFPGLVLAIARPAASYVLMESVRKRAAFLELAAQELPVRDVTVLTSRAEQAGQDPAHRESYDLVLSRAVASLPVLLEYCLPLVRVGGQTIAYKGPDAEEEIGRSQSALTALGGRLGATHRLSLPLQMGDRVLVVVEKAAPTPPSYPRRPDLPAKRPLT